MKLKYFSIAALSVALGVLGSPSTIANYKGQKVIEFSNNQNIHSLLDTLDVWSETKEIVQARVTPSQLEALEKANGGELDYKTLVADLQKQISDSFAEIEFKSNLRSADWFDNYHNYDEIKQWYSDLAINSQGAVRFVSSIGKSTEGKELFAVHITNPSTNEQVKKKVYFESLIHAREWITGSTLQYVLNHLVENRTKDEKIKSLLDQIEIVAVPIVNPDGYAYTWAKDRLWRKNRRAVTGGVGIDLNRNFPFGWGGEGASTNPSSETYRGPYAASELETQAIINYFKKQGPLLGAIDFHSYSQLILRPYGINIPVSPHEAKHKALGEQIKQKIEAVRETKYINQRSIDLYASAGIASDWFHSSSNKTYGYTIELSPDQNSWNGFVLPPSNIVPVGKDLLPAVIQFLDTVLNNPL